MTNDEMTPIKLLRRALNFTGDANDWEVVLYAIQYIERSHIQEVLLLRQERMHMRENENK